MLFIFYMVKRLKILYLEYKLIKRQHLYEETSKALFKRKEEKLNKWKDTYF